MSAWGIEAMTGTVTGGAYRGQKFRMLTESSPAEYPKGCRRTLPGLTELLAQSYQVSLPGWRTVVLQDESGTAVRDVRERFLGLGARPTSGRQKGGAN
jgi:hypothetical protein